MPDLAALLPNAKLAEGAEITLPSAVPETTTVPETPAAPAAVSALLAEYVGMWYGVSMTMDGTTYSLADMGLEMSLEIHADGTFTRTIDNETDAGAMRRGERRGSGGWSACLPDGRPADGGADGVLMTFGTEKPEAASLAPENESAVSATIWACGRSRASQRTA